MAVTREQMVKEGVARMRMLKMFPQPIKEFEEEGKLNLSERHGLLYWLNEEQEKIVRDWEKQHDCVVYHVIHDFTDFGELLTLLYVSNCKEEWEIDREDLKEGIPITYCINLDMPDCSEFGSCAIRPCIGGVRRIF